MMNWYDGNISDAIRLVREQSRTLLVFIRGTDEVSKVVDQLFDADVNAACENCVALRLDASSEATIQFSAVYAVLTVPCIYLIAPNGLALDVQLGSVEKSDLIKWITEKAKRSPSETKPTSESEAEQKSETKPVQSTSNTVFHTEPSLPKNPANEESTSSSQPLEERLKYAQQLLEAKRRLQTEEEKKKAIEAEVARRQAGKAMQNFKERQRATEVEEAIAERRKDEAEARKLREQLLQQIEDDRRAKQERAQMTKNLTNETGPISPVCVANRGSANPISPANCDQVRLQIRLVHGGHVVGKFAPGDTLTGDVRSWLDKLSRDEPDGVGELPSVEDETRQKLLDLCTRGFRFRQLHPSKLFDPEEEARSLADLGLCPSAVLILVPTKAANKFVVQSSQAGLVSHLFGFVQTGLTTFMDYLAWIVGGVYNFGSGLITSVVPNLSGTPNAGSNTTTSRTASENRSSSPAQNRAVRRQGNMARLSHLPDNSDDEQARWNGNSTEQL